MNLFRSQIELNEYNQVRARCGQHLKKKFLGINYTLVIVIQMSGSNQNYEQFQRALVEIYQNIQNFRSDQITVFLLMLGWPFGIVKYYKTQTHRTNKFTINFKESLCLNDDIESRELRHNFMLCIM